MTMLKQSLSDERGQDGPGTVLHWYDFLCPFCYVGQHRTAIFVRHGLRVAELPFQAHPDIPPGGVPAGRDDPMLSRRGFQVLSGFQESAELLGGRYGH